MTDWAQQIKAARLRLGETQTEFARRFGVATNTVSRWETGTYDISLEAVDWLLSLTGQKPLVCPTCGGKGLINIPTTGEPRQ